MHPDELFCNFAYVKQIKKYNGLTSNVRIILSTLLIAAVSLTVSAKTNGGAKAAHDRAHREQLSNVKNRLDKSVINEFIRNDIDKRERDLEKTNGLSAESNQMIADLLKESNKHIGKRYVHGAKGPNQFDCSGFTSYVYRQFGYNISPASRAQYKDGVPVKRDDLRKGDLVFFTSRSSGGNVGHVGIVVSADNDNKTFKFIHASIRGVKISNFEGYYVGRYIGARRIITQ